MDLLARRLLWNVFPALMVLGMIYLALWGDDGLWARHRVDAELARTQRRLDDLDAENARLASEIRALQEDPVAVQRAAASELLLVPPGSTLFHFDD